MTSIQLRPYQRDGLNALWSYFANGNTGNPLLAWPTGVGKTVAPAEFIRETMVRWPTQRFLMITHVSTLIKQNAEVMRYLWPNAPLGIYSAGLNQKQSALPIVFGGIQSMVKHPQLFGWRDIIFIDEAHLVSQDDNSMYLSFIATMRLINPDLKVIGMTATPFRMGQGMLTDSGLFTDIVHDLTSVDNFNKLIADGYLAPLVPRRTKTELDVSNVGMNKYDYIGSQLQSAVDKAEITYAGLQELVHHGQDRRSWLIFASGIEHSEHIADMLGHFGVQCAAVHSKKSEEYNVAAINAHKDGSLRAISNYGKLTTGYNNEIVDLIGMFRPTMSIPLHIQMLGRGTRPANGKTSCLVLDYARNVPRLGPINDPIIPKKKSAEPGDLPIKICEACGTYNHLKVRFCTNCGNEFHFQVKIVPKSGNEEIIRSDFPIVESFTVDRAVYNRRQKDGRPAYIRTTYFCGFQAFHENLFPEGKGYGKHLFHQWWMQRHTAPPPVTADEALEYKGQFRTPKRIRVHVNKQFPEIKSAEF